MAKKTTNKPGILEANMYCLLLRKSAAYLRVNCNSDQHRRGIIHAKYNLAKCDTMYLLLKSFVTNDDTKRWVDSNEFSFKRGWDYDYTDTLTGIYVKVLCNEMENGNRYNSDIRVVVDGIGMENKVENAITLSVFDTMKKMRQSLIALEQEQLKRKKLAEIRNAYAQEFDNEL